MQLRCSGAVDRGVFCSSSGHNLPDVVSNSPPFIGGRFPHREALRRRRKRGAREIMPCGPTPAPRGAALAQPSELYPYASSLGKTHT